MQLNSRANRWVCLGITALVVTLTLVSATRAVAVVTTANAASFLYDLLPNANRSSITPPPNLPVLIMGVCTTNGLGIRGVGHVSLLRSPGLGLEWVGFHSPGGIGGATLATGISGVNGTDIVKISADSLNQAAVIEVAGVDQIRVRNEHDTAMRSGNITLIW